MRYPRALSAVANVWYWSPFWLNVAKPPSGGLLVNTPVLWGKRPVKIDEREGQHSESVTT